MDLSSVPARARLAGSGLCVALLVLAGSVPLPLARAASADDYASADQLGRPDFELMECGKGAFWDPRNGGECWSCGDLSRSVLPVDGDNACQTKSLSDAKAEQLTRNTLSCPGDSFYDPRNGGECWSCPSDTRRSLSDVASDRACLRALAGDRITATYVYNTGSLLKACQKGTFPAAGKSKCYKCPSGYSHNPLRRVDQKGVCFQLPSDEPLAAKKISTLTKTSCERGFFDPIDGGSCWECPSGYARFLTAVTSDNACVAAATPTFTPAKFVKAERLDAARLKSGAERIGCNPYGDDAFFDLKDGGTCWSCPAAHPTRTLYAVDSGRACATKTCGQQGGRPCYVWERFPSCDAGLAEDPIRNECVEPKDLACAAFLGTLGALKQAVEQANAAGEALQDEALERIPGMREVLRFVENQNDQVQKQAQRVTDEMDFAEVTERARVLLTENEALIDRMDAVAAQISDSKAAVESIFLDPEIVCRYDDAAAMRRLEELGILQLLEGEGGAGEARTLNVATSTPVAAVGDRLADLLGPRSMITFDLGVEFPYQGLDWGIGIQWATHGDRSAWYLMHGASKIFKKKDATAVDLGSVGLTVGWSYDSGREACVDGKRYAWGIPIKLAGPVGIGLACARDFPFADFGGLALTIAGADYQRLKPVTTSPGGVVPLPLPAPNPGFWALGLPKPKLEGGFGFEGAILLSNPNDSQPGIF